MMDFLIKVKTAPSKMASLFLVQGLILVATEDAEITSTQPLTYCTRG